MSLAANALVRLCVCAGSSEPTLVTFASGTKISCAVSNVYLLVVVLYVFRMFSWFIYGCLRCSLQLV